jgi:glycosyltransferase involved in cell wall biosynthesis
MDPKAVSATERSDPGGPLSAALAVGTGQVQPKGPPTVSVVIPVYNGAKTVGKAVESVLAQGHSPSELILINDGSLDGSGVAVHELAKTDARIRVIENERNMGLAWALNLGLREASGELVLVLHQDCVLTGPDWISRAVPMFEDPRVISVVGTPRHRVEEMSRLEREFWIIRHHVAPTSDGSPGSPREKLFSENKCDMFRRRALLAIGGFDPRFREGGEDQVLAWRLNRTDNVVRFESGLAFQITLGEGGHLTGHLRKEANYGRQIRQVLFATKFGAVRRSRGGTVDPRLINRAAGVAWILATIAGLIWTVFSREWWFLGVVALFPVLRWVQFTVRGARERRAYRLPTRAVLQLGVLGLIADMAYVAGLITPRGKPRSAPKTVQGRPNVPG